MPSDLNDMTNRMSQLETAWPKPEPEVYAECLRILKERNAMDIAEMLGLVDA